MRCARLLFFLLFALTVCLRASPVQSRLDTGTIYRISPAMPIFVNSIERRLGGPVIVRIRIDSSGTVTNIEHVEGDVQLVPTLKTAIKKWRFKPLSHETTVLSGVNVMPIDFDLYQYEKHRTSNQFWGFRDSATAIVTIAADGTVLDAIGIRGSEETLRTSIGLLLRWRSTESRGSPMQLAGKVDFVYGFRAGTLPSRDKLLDVPAVYPESARKAHVEGTVFGEVVVGENGDVQSVRVFHPANSLLDQAAIEAVKQWRYAPLFVNGEPFRSVETFTVKFPSIASVSK